MDSPSCDGAPAVEPGDGGVARDRVDLLVGQADDLLQRGKRSENLQVEDNIHRWGKGGLLWFTFSRTQKELFWGLESGIIMQ